MLDPVLGSILFGIAGVSFMVGGYSAFQYRPREKRSSVARQTAGSRFRQSVMQAKIPALLVFLPTAISSILVYLFIGRAGAPPPTNVQLMEIGSVLLILGTTIGGSTLIGSLVAEFLPQTPSQE